MKRLLALLMALGLLMGNQAMMSPVFAQDDMDDSMDDDMSMEEMTEEEMEDEEDEALVEAFGEAESADTEEEIIEELEELEEMLESIPTDSEAEEQGLLDEDGAVELSEEQLQAVAKCFALMKRIRQNRDWAKSVDVSRARFVCNRLMRIAHLREVTVHKVGVIQQNLGSTLREAFAECQSAEDRKMCVKEQKEELIANHKDRIEAARDRYKRAKKALKEARGDMRKERKERMKDREDMMDEMEDEMGDMDEMEDEMDDMMEDMEDDMDDMMEDMVNGAINTILEDPSQIDNLNNEQLEELLSGFTVLERLSFQELLADFGDDEGEEFRRRMVVLSRLQKLEILLSPNRLRSLLLDVRDAVRTGADRRRSQQRNR